MFISILQKYGLEFCSFERPFVLSTMQRYAEKIYKTNKKTSCLR